MVLTHHNGDDEKDYLENKKESAKKQLSYVKNIKYIAINKDTNEVYSNTDYKTIEDFKKMTLGETIVEKVVSNKTSINNLILIKIIFCNYF